MTVAVPLPMPADVAFGPADWSPVDPVRVVAGAPQSALRILYSSSDEKFCAGVYACTAGTWRVSYSEDEFCTLIEGRVRLIHDNGNVYTYAAPDSFLIPAGFSGLWEAGGNLRKYFVIYERGI